MICHAPQAAVLPVLPLAVAVVELCFLASPVALIGAPPLFPPRFLPARFPAVAMPSVAGIADVEHQSAGRPAASQPTQHHFSGHRTPRVGITAICRGAPSQLQPCPSAGTDMKETPIVGAIGVSLLGIFLPCGADVEQWQNLVIAPEARCAPCDNGEFRYPQSGEPGMDAGLGGVRSRKLP